MSTEWENELLAKAEAGEIPEVDDVPADLDQRADDEGDTDPWHPDPDPSPFEGEDPPEDYYDDAVQVLATDRIGEHPQTAALAAIMRGDLERAGDRARVMLPTERDELNRACVMLATLCLVANEMEQGGEEPDPWDYVNTLRALGVDLGRQRARRGAPPPATEDRRKAFEDAVTMAEYEVDRLVAEGDTTGAQGARAVVSQLRRLACPNAHGWDSLCAECGAAPASADHAPEPPF